MNYLPALLVGGPKDGVVWHVKETAPLWECISFPAVEDPNLPGCCLMYARREFILRSGEVLIYGQYNGLINPEGILRARDWACRLIIFTVEDARRLMEPPPSVEPSKRLINPSGVALHDGSALTMEECGRLGMKVRGDERP